MTLFTARSELFVEFPVPVRGRPVEFAAHVTVLATGAPVSAGSMRVTARSPAGREVQATADQPRRPGLFVPALVFEDNGDYALSLVVSGSHEDRFDLGLVTVHADEETARAAHDPDHEQEEAADVVPFLLEQQWRVGTRLHLAAREELIERVQVPGRVLPRHGYAAHVTPPVAGSIVAPEGGLPDLGQRAEKGRLMAWIRPPLPVADVAALAANRSQLAAQRRELVLRRTDLGVRAAELAASRATLAIEIDHATRTRDRVRTLHGQGLATAQEADDADNALRLAANEHEGVERLAAEVHAALERLATLERDAADEERRGQGAQDGLLLPLYAPIDGVIVRAECIEGQFFEVDETVFEIIDASTVWVEARVPEFDLSALDEDPSALLAIPGRERVTLDLRHVEGSGPVHRPLMVDSTTHASALLFEVPNADGRLRIGMSLDVYLATRTVRDAVSIPRAAVVDENGQPTAYVLIDGEHFQKRFLEIGIEDGERVEVKSGVSDGERVVSHGAYTIRLASLAPDSLAEGHHHH